MMVTNCLVDKLGIISCILYTVMRSMLAPAICYFVVLMFVWKNFDSRLIKNCDSVCFHMLPRSMASSSSSFGLRSSSLLWHFSWFDPQQQHSHHVFADRRRILRLLWRIVFVSSSRGDEVDIDYLSRRRLHPGCSCCYDGTVPSSDVVRSRYTRRYVFRWCLRNAANIPQYGWSHRHGRSRHPSYFVVWVAPALVLLLPVPVSFLLGEVDDV